jgi:phosphoserine aminotransferase
VWAKKAIKEAKAFGEVEIVASSEADNFTYVPKDFAIPADADYLHITTNNTIYGTELRYDIDSPVPVIADMSSDIFSRPIDVSKYGMIYGGAQKNLSMSGVTFVIVKDELLGKVSRHIPTMLDYKTHVSKGSMFNTPPVVPIYCAMQTLRWIKQEGGVAEMARRAEERAALLYAEIDRNKLFRGTAREDSRSLMNICFVMNDEYKELEQEFLQYAQQLGIVGIKGHRDVGGFRASCYNAMPLEGVKALIKVMQDFEAAKG